MTEKHVRELFDSDPEEALKALYALKKRLGKVANDSYGHLSNTYGQVQLKGDKKVQQIIRNEQIAIIDKLLPVIDSVALELGRIRQDQKAREVSQFLSPSTTLYESPPAEDEEESKKAPVGTLASLIDRTVDREWANISQGIKTPEEFVREFVIGKTSEGKQEEIVYDMVKDKEGKSVTMPHQMAIDLPRIVSFCVNGSEVYSNLKTFKYTSVQAYLKLQEACYAKVGKKNGNILAERIGRMINQGMFADILLKIRTLYAVKGENVLLSGSGQSWNIDLQGKNILITLKMSVNLRPLPEDGFIDDTAPPDKSVLVKREVEIPLADLTTAADPKNLEDPLPGVHVSDTFSKEIGSVAYAETLLDLL